LLRPFPCVTPLFLALARRILEIKVATTEDSLRANEETNETLLNEVVIVSQDLLDSLAFHDVHVMQSTRRYFLSGRRS
jgi:hypothetical protein